MNPRDYNPHDAYRATYEAAMEPLRKQMRLTELQALKRELERNARVRKLLQDVHSRISNSTPQWGDHDLLQRISEEIMEGGL